MTQTGRQSRQSHGNAGSGRGETREMSTFELDVYWAERGADGEAGGDPAVASHVAGCARCQAYLSSLDALEARAPAVPRVSSVRPRARSNRALWALPVTGALAAAAAVGLYVHGRNLESDHYVGIKGTPAVQVLVHRGQATRIWDGHSPLHPGDALALRVACEGLKRVVVASPGGTSGDGHWGRLSDVACPAGDDPLPFTLQVDSEPGDEKLAVVLTQDSIDDPTLQKAIDEERHAQDVWVVRYVMPKETETDR